MTDWKSLKVTELKAELATRALSTAGKKDELVARLIEHDASTQVPTPTEPASASASSVNQAPVASSTAAESDTVAVPLPDLAAAGTTATTEANPAVTADTTASTTTTSTSTAEAVAALEARLKARAARFGNSLAPAPIASSPEVQSAEEEKRRKRAARFGMPTAEEVLLKEQAAKLVTGSTAGAPTGPAAGRERLTWKESREANKAAKQQQASNSGQQQQQQKQKAPGQQTEKKEKRTAKVLDDPVEAEKARKRALKFGGAPATPATTTTT